MEQNAKSVPPIALGEKDLSKSLQVFKYKEHAISSFIENGVRYYSATEMAKPYNAQPAHFLASKNVQNFVSVLDESLSYKNSYSLKSTIVINGKHGGTWVCEELALKFAGWLNPHLELWMIRTVLHLVKGEASPTRKGMDITIFEQVESKQELNGHTYYKIKELYKLVGRKKAVSVKRLRKAYGACVVKLDDTLYITKAAFVLFMKRSDIATEMHQSRKELPKLAGGQYEIFTPSQLNPQAQ
jgi:KilA-N domain